MSNIELLPQQEQAQAQAPAAERLTAFERYRNQILGEKLVWFERRLFARLHCYIKELERHQETTADQWRPRVMFLEVIGPCSLIQFGDHAHLIPHWRLISVFDRKQWAIATARAKIQLVDHRIARVQNIFEARRREIERIQDQNHRLRILLAPRQRARA